MGSARKADAGHRSSQIPRPVSRVLADTSVWVEMFRGRDTPAIRKLGQLLLDGLVCTNGLVRAEILSGARSKGDYRKLEETLSALTLLEDPPELWDTVARTRYLLARKGIQAAIADLVVAACAAHHRKILFTLDHAFPRIRSVLRFELFSPEH